MEEETKSLMLSVFETRYAKQKKEKKKKKKGSLCLNQSKIWPKSLLMLRVSIQVWAFMLN